MSILGFLDFSLSSFNSKVRSRHGWWTDKRRDAIYVLWPPRGRI